MATAALAESRRSGDRATEARCLATLARAVLVDDPAACRSHASEGMGIASEIGDLWCETSCRISVALAHIVQGRAEEAEKVVLGSPGSALGRDGGMTSYVLGYVDLLRGHFDEAMSKLQDCRNLGRRTGDPALELWSSAVLALVAAAQGKPGDIAEVAAELTQRTRQWGLLGDILIPAIVAISRLTEAPHEAAATLAVLAEAQLHSDAYDSSATFYLAALAALEDGDVGAAEAAAERSLSKSIDADLFIVPGLLLVLARVALNRGDAPAADEHAHAALAVQAERGTRVFLADNLDLLGRSSISGGSPAKGVRLIAAADALRTALDQPRLPSLEREVVASLEVARTELGEAFSSAWSDGRGSDIDEIISYARRTRGRRRRPIAGWASLTPTEVDVARLAAQGLTNPEIGERLFIGRGTVKTHLSHVFAKLGVSNRAELAAEATRHQSM